MRILALVFALLAAAPARAQSDKVVPITVATTGATASITLEGRQGVSVVADGTCTSLAFAPQVSTNGTVWAATQMYNVATQAFVTSAGEGTFIIVGIAGMMQARLNITALTATCDFTLRATMASQLPATAAGAASAITSFPDNEPFNVAQINGVTPLMGNGASGTGTLRVSLANDSTGVISGITNAITAESTDSTEQGHPRRPTAVGTSIELTCTTSTSTGTVVDATEYRLSLEGAGARVIWGGTATLTTGFYVSENGAEYQRGEGTSVACITRAGTGYLSLIPVVYTD